MGEELVAILDLDDDAAKTLLERISQDRPYVVLARDLGEDVTDRIRPGAGQAALGVSVEPEPVRVYPQPGGGPDDARGAAARLRQPRGEGQYGVEQAYQSMLSGEPKVVIAERDAHGRAIPTRPRWSTAAPRVRTSALTIDAASSSRVEQELLATWVADKAKSVSAVVMDPYTGEIYAEATDPGYDANTTARSPHGTRALHRPGRQRGLRARLGVQDADAVAALETKTVGLKTKVNDSGTLKLDGGQTTSTTPTAGRWAG